MLEEFTLAFGTGLLALFLALPMFALRAQRRANVWLGLFILCFGMLASAETYYRYHMLAGWLDLGLGFMAPSFYLYVRNLTGAGNGRAQLWHVVPGLAWATLFLAARIELGADRLVEHLTHGRLAWFLPGLLVAEALACAYAVAVLRLLARYRRRLPELYAAPERRDLRWLAQTSAALLALLLLWIPASLFGGWWGAALAIGRLVFLAALGWLGMRYASVFLASPDPVLAPGAPEPAPEREKYARSGMNDGARQLIGERLAGRMDAHRDFLEPDISLSLLAERIGTSSQLLSQYLNDEMRQNFFGYVNGLRIAAVQRAMLDPAQAHRTIIELAFACGFNSKSTFNASFKAATGMTPSAWRLAHGAAGPTAAAAA